MDHQERVQYIFWILFILVKLDDEQLKKIYAIVHQELLGNTGYVKWIMVLLNCNIYFYICSLGGLKNECTKR